jgi:hypothetical protein
MTSEESIFDVDTLIDLVLCYLFFFCVFLFFFFFLFLGGGGGGGGGGSLGSAYDSLILIYLVYSLPLVRCTQ